MTRRLIIVLAVALAVVVALGSTTLAITKAGAKEPTLTVTRDCETYGPDFESVHIRLAGFPAFTPFDWSYAVSVDETGLGPVHDTTDAAGNAAPDPGGLSGHGRLWTVAVVWSGGTLTQSLYVDCTRPEGAVTVIPPEEYSRYGSNCTPNGVALQGHGYDDTLYGTRHYDLLRGGEGDDSLAGASIDDCLFGQKGADEISGGSGYDHIFGGRGPDVLNGDPGGDWIRGGRGKDTIRGGKKYDHIIDTDGRNRITCGGGPDTIVTNQRSKVAPNCEHVTRR
jgi:hypothetical protein